jgi:ribosome-associated translation inhibitor RaiA
MTHAAQVSFRNIPVSPALEQEIRARVAWLETFYSGIVGCRVVIEVPHRHRARGRPVRVRVELSLPGDDIVVSHAPTLHATLRRLQGDEAHKCEDVDGARKDALVAIHDAFDTARRRLEDYARRQRGDVPIGDAAPAPGA